MLSLVCDTECQYRLTLTKLISYRTGVLHAMVMDRSHAVPARDVEASNFSSNSLLIGMFVLFLITL